jgi:hypothetical protein
MPHGSSSLHSETYGDVRMIGVATLVVGLLALCRRPKARLSFFRISYRRRDDRWCVARRQDTGAVSCWHSEARLRFIRNLMTASVR